VVAPFDGVITQRNIDVGSLVQADATSGTFMFTLMHSDVMRIQLYVPQDEAFGVAPGTQAVVRVPEMPGRDFPGTVTRIADALQPGSRTLLTEIDVPNPDHALSPGVYCNVELKIPRKTPSLDRSVRGDHLQPRRSERRGGRGRRRAHSQDHRCARFRYDRRSQRRR
jgi:multidrug efflux pump subunit AcrA (membrane-fusion protein)